LSLYSISDPSIGETYAAILHRSGKNEVTVEADAPAPLEIQHWSMHSFGAMFAEVRVNAITGETRVSRFLGPFHCRRILNPKTAASQFRGGITMGPWPCPDGKNAVGRGEGAGMNPSLAEYHVPVHIGITGHSTKKELLITDVSAF
jgi:xanthine dehydrogenase YagR molybdenum-binding subunit